MVYIESFNYLYISVLVNSSQGTLNNNKAIPPPHDSLSPPLTPAEEGERGRDLGGGGGRVGGYAPTYLPTTPKAFVTPLPLPPSPSPGDGDGEGGKGRDNVMRVVKVSEEAIVCVCIQGFSHHWLHEKLNC